MNPDDFQLYLLRSMMPQPSLLEPSLRARRKSESEMEEKFEAFSAATRFRTGSSGVVRDALAAVVVNETVDPGNDTISYGFDLWPDFVFSIGYRESMPLIAPHGFVRRKDPAGVASVAPWCFLESEIADVFDDIETIDMWGTTPITTRAIRKPGNVGSFGSGGAFCRRFRRWMSRHPTKSELMM
ncbi:hypothetical protein ACQPW1_19655 [Nocardia sp. CA-128927]|uniref:hypothetical protein n=1 Tax=Nocardia sp. CA-128927 TaxID=3239975 RepID=UPI003D96A910